MYKNIQQPNVNSVPSEFNGGLTYPQTVHELVERVNSIDDGTAEIKDGSVTSIKLADGSVVTPKLQNKAVTTDKIADKAITTELIGDSEVTPEKISSVSLSQITTVVPEGQVIVANGGKLAGEKITKVPEPLTAGKVLTSIPNGMAWLEPTAVPEIGDNSITNAMLAPSSVDESKLADGAVTTSKYARNSITNEKLGINSVTNANIADGSLDPAKLSSIPPSEIGDKSITQAKMADNSVGSPQLIDGSVTDTKIAVESVGTTNLQDACVTVSKLSGTGGTSGQVLGTTDGVNVAWLDQKGGGGLPPEASITTAMLQDGSVTGAKLGVKAVGAVNIDDGTITGQKVAMATLEADHINSQGATVGQILTAGAGNTAMWGDVPPSTPAKDSITTEMLKNSSVTTNKIKSKAVDFTLLSSSACRGTTTYKETWQDNQVVLCLARPLDVSNITQSDWVLNETNGLYEYTTEMSSIPARWYIGQCWVLPWFSGREQTIGDNIPMPYILTGTDNKVYPAIEYVSHTTSRITYIIRSNKNTYVRLSLLAMTRSAG